MVESLIEVGGFAGNTGLEGLVQYCNCSAGGRLNWRSFGAPFFAISGSVPLAVVGRLSLIRTAGRCDTGERLRHGYRWRMANLLYHNLS